MATGDPIAFNGHCLQHLTAIPVRAELAADAASARHTSCLRLKSG